MSMKIVAIEYTVIFYITTFTGNNQKYAAPFAIKVIQRSYNHITLLLQQNHSCGKAKDYLLDVLSKY